MPFRSQSLDDRVSHRLLAFLASGGIAVSMAIDTPSISVLLDERRRRIERLRDSQYVINIETRINDLHRRIEHRRNVQHATQHHKQPQPLPR